MSYTIHKKNILLLACTSLLALSNTSSAYSWPIFTPPTLETLQPMHVIDTASCPAGEGRIPSGLHLPIKDNFCKGFCPTAWEWVSTSDNQCHPLNESLAFKQFQFEYHKSGQGENETAYTIITAQYNDNLSFTFTSEQDNHWQCSELVQLTTPLSALTICENNLCKNLIF